MKHEETKEMLRFRIDQLRKDKMIYALESIALTFIAELVYVFLSVILGTSFSPMTALVIILIPVAYFLYMAVGNTIRFMKLKKLEKELYKE